jgi:hypothetical protein
VAMGIPEEEARYYQSEFELGHPIVAVEAGDRREEALLILRTNGAYDITTPRGTSDPNAQARTSTPNAPPQTDESMGRPQTYETQPRQTDTWDDRNA